MKDKEFDPKYDDGYDPSLDNKYPYPESPSSSFKEDVSNRSYTELFSKLEELGHGEKLTKIIAKDAAVVYADGDFGVEIHALVDESNRFYIISEKVTRYNLEKNVYEEVKKS